MVDNGGLHAITDPIGMEILAELSKGPANVSELARRLNRPRPTVAYHLGNLERFKILKSKYEIIRVGNPKGRAARMYSINERKLKECVREAENLFSIVKSK